MYYFSSKNNTHWVKMESHDLKLSLPLFMYSDTTKKLQKQTGNPILKNIIQIWHDVCTVLNTLNTFSQFTPIWGNQFFVSGKIDATFKRWADAGLKSI